MADAKLSFSETFADLQPVIDLAIENGDLALDQGFVTPTIVSLLSDRLANEDDKIPDGSVNRRGWWGDDPVDPANTSPTRVRIGSRLWLLAREKQTNQTLNFAISYAREALQWMLDRGIAAQIDVTGDFGEPSPQLSTIILHVSIDRQILGGSTINNTFDVAWDATMIGV